MVSTKKNVPGEGNRGLGDESPAQEGGNIMLKRLEMFLEAVYSECAHTA